MTMKRNQREIQMKLQEQMERAGMDVMLVTSPEAVFYCTGFASQFLYISNRIGMAVAVVPAKGKITLIVSGFEKLAAEQAVEDVNVEAYPVWIYIRDLDDGREKDAQPDMNQTFRMAAEIASGETACRCVGVQMEGLPFQKWEYLCGKFGREKMADCEPVLRNARVRKTEWEIGVLRKNTRLLETAMYQTYLRIQPGMKEQEIYSLWNQISYSLSPEVYNVFHTHVMGENWSPRLIPDGRYTVEEGDIIRMDGAIWTNGYGSDLGRACAVGGKARKESMNEVYKALYEGYQTLITAVGPGVRLCDVFHKVVKAVQKSIPEYQRGHVGHSLGCNRFSEEYPFIAPDETSMFEPGMIFCTEVPYYSSENHSYNLEDTLLVTENGIELFSHIPSTLSWKMD